MNFISILANGCQSQFRAVAPGKQTQALGLERTSQIIYADPGISLNRGKSLVTLSVPVRVHVNRFKSVLEAHSPAGPLSLNGGGFAKYLFFLSYSYRI